MAMDAATIERLIREGLPDARVSIEDLRGDGATINEIIRRHYGSTTWMRWMVSTGVSFQRSARPSSPVTTMRRPL